MPKLKYKIHKDAKGKYIVVKGKKKYVTKTKKSTRKISKIIGGSGVQLLPTAIQQNPYYRYPTSRDLRIATSGTGTSGTVYHVQPSTEKEVNSALLNKLIEEKFTKKYEEPIIQNIPLTARRRLSNLPSYEESQQTVVDAMAGEGARIHHIDREIEKEIKDQTTSQSINIQKKARLDQLNREKNEAIEAYKILDKERKTEFRRYIEKKIKKESKKIQEELQEEEEEMEKLQEKEGEENEFQVKYPETKKYRIPERLKSYADVNQAIKKQDEIFRKRQERITKQFETPGYEQPKLGFLGRVFGGGGTTTTTTSTQEEQ